MRAGLLLIMAGLLAAPAAGGILFEDDFSGPPKAEWGNEIGSWGSPGNVYYAEVPGNFPNAHSSLPYELNDFTFGVTIWSALDGGVWLRSAPAGGPIGRTGVLLVTRNRDLYWHIVTGSSYGATLNLASNVLGSPSTRLHIDVTGTVYNVYPDGALTPATSLDTDQFASGQVALYSNSTQTFDNVVLTPEPGVLLLLGIGGLALLGIRARTPSDTKTPESGGVEPGDRA